MGKRGGGGGGRFDFPLLLVARLPQSAVIRQLAPYALEVVDDCPYLAGCHGS